MPAKKTKDYEPFREERGRDADDLVREAAVMNVAPFLRGIEFPATKQAIRTQAEKRGADADALAQVDQLPDNPFRTPMDLIDALGDEAEPLLRRLGGEHVSEP